MKYFCYLHPLQKEFIADLIEDTSIIEQFNDYIEEEPLLEIESLLIAHLYREKFRKEKERKMNSFHLNKQDEARQMSTYQLKIEEEKIKNMAAAIAQAEIKRIEHNIKFMPINQKIETIMDTLCHQSLDWMDENLNKNKTTSLSPQDVKINKQKIAKSFSKKSLNLKNNEAPENKETPENKEILPLLNLQEATLLNNQNTTQTQTISTKKIPSINIKISNNEDF